MKTSVTIVNHPPMEFLYALFAVGTRKHFLSMMGDFRLPPDQDFMELMERLDEALSPFQRQELAYFYGLSGLGYLFYKTVLRNGSESDVPSLIAQLEQAGPAAFLHDMMMSVCPGIYRDADAAGDADVERLSQMLRQASFQDEERRQRALEAAAYPEEVHGRFVFFLKQFYRSGYSGLQQWIGELLSPVLAAYRKEYDEAPERFTRQYLNTPYQELSGSTVVHVSLFKQVGWHTYRLEEPGLPQWFILGIHGTHAPGDIAGPEQLTLFFKALSDPKRIEIVRLLSERPYYGQELAEKLNVTAATISYHMTFLLNQNMVVYERMDNRFYYSLHIGAIEQLLEQVRLGLLSRKS